MRGLKSSECDELIIEYASHPTRVRGLKLRAAAASGLPLSVAPYTGAWIEIFCFLRTYSSDTVAPYTGAWIEIDQEHPLFYPSEVAPYTGAWIEIFGFNLQDR